MTLNMDLNVARPMKLSEQDTVKYEWDMLQFAWKQINKAAKNGVTDQYAYMYLECFLLHYRSLIQFLAVKGQRNGDLSLATFTADIQKATCDEIERLAKPLREKYSDSISKYLAHCTTRRHKTDITWPANTMYCSLLPAIQLLPISFGLQELTDEPTCLLPMSHDS
jgi:hypothetical protein